MNASNQCKYYNNGVCKLASQHAGKDVLTSIEACSRCQKQMCNIPASLALTAIGAPIPNSKKYLLQYIVKTYRILLTEGVGTELEKLIKKLSPIVKWLYPLTDLNGTCESCASLKFRMNDWTVTDIKNNLNSILSEMQSRAKEQHLPYSRIVYTGLIYVAIFKHKRNVRKSVRYKP